MPQHGDLDDHHIVPKDWKGYTNNGTSIDSILNRTPLTGDTNRNVIRERLPNEYLPEMIAANGEATVREILESHLISPAAFNILLRKPFTMSDFEAFVAERQRANTDAIEDLLMNHATWVAQAAARAGACGSGTSTAEHCQRCTSE